MQGRKLGRWYGPKLQKMTLLTGDTAKVVYDMASVSLLFAALWIELQWDNSFSLLADKTKMAWFLQPVYNYFIRNSDATN